MARALSQILTELNSVYNPQRDLYNAQINALDPQQAADEKGLDAAKTDSFAQIQNDANRRGLNFSGIPLAEQAKYLGSTYLPSVANLKAQYAQKKFNLRDALLSLDQKQYGDANSIYQTELDRDAEASAARAAAGSTLNFGGGGGFSGYTPNVLGAKTSNNAADPTQNPLYRAVFFRADGSKWGDKELISDYAATAKSAAYGNVRDQQKLALYQAIRPDLFAGARNLPVGVPATYNVVPGNEPVLSRY